MDSIGHMVGLFFNVLRNLQKWFPQALIFILSDNVELSPSPHILTVLVSMIFHVGYSHSTDMVSHCCLDLNFSDNQ